MRRTKVGAFLIEINNGRDSADVVRDEVTRSLRPGAKVWKLKDTYPIEIRDLDGETTREEVLNALTDPTDDNSARLISLRKAFGGTQITVVVLLIVVAKRLCAQGRLRMELVYARVRPTEIPTRCYTCLTFDHVLRICTGTDRRACCWRCGKKDHVYRDYTVAPDAGSAQRDSCRPGSPVAEFEGFLSGLEDDVRGRYIPVSALIMAGNFNVKSFAWGSRGTDPRGEMLERFAAALDLLPENVGSVRLGSAEMVPTSGGPS